MLNEFLKRQCIKIRRIFETPENVRIGIFNLMSFVGFCVSLTVFVSSLFNDAAVINLASTGFSAVLSVTLFLYSKKTGKYRVCYIITIVVMFIILFPLMFFTAGGMHSGMPMFFSFAVVFTIFMLENKTGLIISAFELAEFLVCCLLSAKYPSMVIFFETEEAVYRDIVLGIIACTVSLAVTVYLQAMLYRRQHTKTQEALEDAELQSRAKDIFLANMSHEIRTPINILLGMSEMIERTSSDENVLSYNHNIRMFGNQLQDMVKDILDITRIETGKITLRNEPYSLEELVSGLEVAGKELAREKELDFKLVRDYNKSYFLYGDTDRIKQIIMNLINNAVKYTKQGHVKVHINADDNGKSCRLSFTVEDTGIGIPEEEKEKIFEMFHRIDTEHGRTVEGTGLGLAITRQLVELMDGDISLESNMGKGTKFYVNLEQNISETEVELTESSEGVYFIAPNAGILVADDNRDNLQIMKLILERTMMKIDTAAGGEEAVRLAENKKYDIIILDYMMPDMNGIQVLEKMKENGTESVFISLTADAVAGTAEKILGAGFDEYVTKPVNWMNFEKLLMKYIPDDKIVFESRNCDNAADCDRIVSLNSIAAGKSIEISSALKRVGGNIATYGRILRLFCDNYSVNSAEGKKLFEAGDYEALTFIVHSLKSQALGIGATELNKIAAALEKHLKAGDSSYVVCAFSLLMLEWKRAAECAELLSDEIRKNEPERNYSDESETILVRKAVEALRNNVWLEAKSALESLYCKFPDKDIYRLAMEKTDNLEFRKAEEFLGNI